MNAQDAGYLWNEACNETLSINPESEEEFSKLTKLGCMMKGREVATCLVTHEVTLKNQERFHRPIRQVAIFLREWADDIEKLIPKDED